MAGNETSRLCWAYQTAAGTTAIDEATDTTYFFSGKASKDQQWSSPVITHDVEVYYAYASREPTLTQANPAFPTYKVGYLPTTAQHAVWQMKQVEEDGGGANVHLTSCLDSGLPLPLTIRLELNDGSVDRRIQISDCYGVGLYCRAMYNAPYFVESEFAYGFLNDEGDYVKLTTAPVAPGQTATNVYNGTPNVYWDTGDDNVQLTECWKAEWIHTQNYEGVLNTAATQQTVYIYEQEPIPLTLEAVLQRSDVWTDLIDRNSGDMSVTVYKPNTNYYIKHMFGDCEVIKVEETGHQFKGHYNARIFLKAASYTNNFTLESETNWSTHYKAVA